MIRSLVLRVALGAALLGAAPAVTASTGVSIDVSRIDVAEFLAPGGAYRLPTFGVRNPGTESTSYRLVVTYIDGQADGSPPESWFAFEPGDLTLQPDQSRPVLTRVTVPPDAAPGRYSALIGPQIVGSGDGAQVGAAAAVRLTFTVGESDGLEAWLRMIGRFISENPWVLALGELLVLLVAIRYIRRRFEFQVARRA